MKKRIVSTLILFFLALLVWLPLCMLVTGALCPTAELGRRLSGVLGGTDVLATWPLITTRPTVTHVLELLLDTPAFYVVFWNSVIQTLPSVLGQLLVSTPAAWAMARYSFPGKKALRWIYILLMILPFQVTMASGYFVLNTLGLVDTHLAIILPAVFSAFPVFIMTRFFEKIPAAVLEAARLDGAGEWRLFVSIGLPMGLPGMLSAALLGFVESWNAVEQPITYLKTPSLYPLSVFLPPTTVENAGVSFVCALVALLPAVLLFLWGQEYLEQGIIASGIKEQ